jgi:glycosyltransferase involved in cell wall biosynthesis
LIQEDVVELNDRIRRLSSGPSDGDSQRRNTALSVSAQAKPWLSVIMPVHCGERWIDASLASLAAGGAEGIEVLVIDSSPTSASIKIAQRYSDRLQIRIFEERRLVSWQGKTNLGVTLARSDHICWLHQDDLWLPNRAALARAWIKEAPEAVLHLSPSAILNARGELLGSWRCPFSGERELDPSTVLQQLLIQNFIAAPAPIFRRDAWLVEGGLDEALWYTADWDMWLKLAGRGATRHHDPVTTGFRVHGSSLTITGSRDIPDFESQMRLVLDRHFARVPNASPAIRRASIASIKVNAALAAAWSGNFRRLLPAAAGMLVLGPTGIHRYLKASRIIDRVLPRVRAKLSGAL